MHITVNDTPVPIQVIVPLKAEANGHLYDIGTLTFETDDSRTAHLDTAAITDVVRKAEAALAAPSKQPHPSKDVSYRHVISLGGTPGLTHPAGCTDPDGCLFTAAAAALTTTMLAAGGTWTCELTDSGALILLNRITA